MAGPGLADIAVRNGWTASDLAMLFGYEWDELNPVEKSVAGVIARALWDGDDSDWIKEMVSRPCQGK